MGGWHIAMLLIVGAVGALSFAAMFGLRVKLSRRMNRAVFWAMALVFWQGPTNDATDILYCDTSIVGETNRQCATVHFHPDPVEAPHVVLSSPNTIFVNDDDDNGNGTNDFVDAMCPFAVEDDDIAEISAGFESFGCMTNGTLRLAAEGARIWDNRRHIGTPVASVTMTNCVTPFRRSFYIERDSLAYSTVDGVKLSLEWIERENDALGVVANRLTAVEPIVEPICSEMVVTDGTRFVVNPALVIPGGPKASFKFTIFPTDYPQSEILWCCDNTDISFWGGNTGTNVLLVASDNMVFDGQTESRLSINIGNAPSAAPFFCFVVAHSKVIKLHTRILSSSFTYKTPISAEELKQLNGVFTQIGIKFVIENHGAIKRDELSVYDANAPASALLMEELTENDDGISVFFVDRIDNAVAFTEPICGMVFVQRNCDWMVLAHELGHSLGADDIYWTSAHRWPDDPVSKVVGPFNASVVDADVDWNNGTGQRFYNNGFAHKELIERILMYGVMGYNGVDIPHSSVFGVASGGINGAKFEIRYTRVGRDAMNGEGGL